MRIYLQKYGIEARLIYNSTKTRASLYANVGKEKGAIVLNGHLDTVPAMPENWEVPPLTLTEYNGKFVGRGVCDMKGAIAASLSLVPKFIKEKANISFIFTHDEEKAGRGCREVLAEQESKETLAKASGVIVMEPTNRRVVAQDS